MDSTLVVERGFVLKPLKPYQAESVFAVVEKNRSRLREFLPWLDFNRSARDSENFIINAAKTNLLGTSLILGIFLEDKFVGMVSYNSIQKQNRSAQIGYWLCSSAQGKGVMIRAVRRLMDFGFKDLNLNRIEIRAAPHNRKSRAIPEAIGFREEGTLRETEWLYDHFVDLVVYSFLRSDSVPTSGV